MGMTSNVHRSGFLDVDARPDGGFTFSIAAEVGYGIQSLSQAEALQMCGWIIGKAAVRALAEPEPEAAAAPADLIERRPGYWTLKAHAISMPPGVSSPDAVRSELFALGIRFTEVHVSAVSITFKGCVRVPARLPGWLTAEEREDSDHA